LHPFVRKSDTPTDELISEGKEDRSLQKLVRKEHRQAADRRGTPICSRRKMKHREDPEGRKCRWRGLEEKRKPRATSAVEKRGKFKAHFENEGGKEKKVFRGTRPRSGIVPKRGVGA